MAATTLTLFIIALIFPFGQLLRVNTYGISFPLLDLVIFVLLLTNLFYRLKKKKLQPRNHYFLFFLIFTWLSLFFNLYRHQITSPKPVLYLIRLNTYLLFFVFPLTPKLIPSKFHRFFQISIISSIIFGILQYFYWPNFTYFDSLNWDPHLYRLVGSFLDPTFTALIFLLFLIQTFFSRNQPLKKPIIVLTYLAIALSYSRSTLLSFLFAFFLISRQLKNKKIFIISLIITLGTLFLLPRQPGEGTKLERTSTIKAKIENYKEAFQTFSTSPIIGHGYNTLYFVRQIDNPLSHSNFGFDNSLLTILCTTGILGFSLFLLGLIHLIKNSTPSKKILISAVLLHSFFSNSLLYPWVLALLVLY